MKLNLSLDSRLNTVLRTFILPRRMRGLKDSQKNIISISDYCHAICRLKDWGLLMKRNLCKGLLNSIRNIK